MFATRVFACLLYGDVSFVVVPKWGPRRVSPADHSMPSWISEARAPGEFTCLSRARAREAVQPITFLPTYFF